MNLEAEPCSHPIRVPRICKNAIKHKIHVSHLHCCPATKQDREAQLRTVPDKWKVEAQRKVDQSVHIRGEEGNVSKPVQEEDSSDHLIGIGPGPGSPHLLPIQDIKYTLPRENQNLTVSIILQDGTGAQLIALLLHPHSKMTHCVTTDKLLSHSDPQLYHL